jgi:hypothetical protein
MNRRPAPVVRDGKRPSRTIAECIGAPETEVVHISELLHDVGCDCPDGDGCQLAPDNDHRHQQLLSHFPGAAQGLGGIDPEMRPEMDLELLLRTPPKLHRPEGATTDGWRLRVGLRVYSIVGKSRVQRAPLQALGWSGRHPLVVGKTRRPLVATLVIH